MSESLRRRELSRSRDLLDAGDLEAASQASRRLVTLFPLDAEVRVQAAALARARGDVAMAGAHLFLTPDVSEADLPALSEFEQVLARDPLRGFFQLGLRDVPLPEALPVEPRNRLDALLAQLEQLDYSRQRLDALLYASRRGLSSSERRHALGCLALCGLVCLGVVVLAALGLANLLSAAR